MALIFADRVLEITSSTGTGAITLAGAVTGHQRFSAVMSVADTCYYSIFAIDGSGNPSGAWETGIGTYTGANTLTRTEVAESSNAGAAVDFAAGTKYVMLTATAEYLADSYTDEDARDALAAALVAGAGITITPNDGDDEIEIEADFDTVADRDYVDAAVASVTPPSVTQGNGIISGLGVAYSGTGLGFTMSAGTANISGELVTASAQSVTLDAADATHPRIDVFYLDDTGTFGKITGTAAVNPSQPAVDPTSQLYLGFALVPATATDLTAGITTETIYNEGTEWTATTSGSGFAVDSTNNPNSGTKCIEGTAVAAGAYVKFMDGSPASFDGDGNLVLSIRSKASWNNKRSLVLQWYASGVARGSAVTLKEGTFGFSSANTTTYQTLVIGKALFAVPAGTTADELRITAAGSGGAAIGFYIDPILLQTFGTGTGGSGGGTTSGFTQDQADARYLRLTGGTLSGDLSVPDEAYDATAWNGSLEVPTKNAVRDAIEAVVPGDTLTPSFNFTDDGEARLYAYEAMTLTQQATSGTGSVAYEKSTNAAPGTFSGTSSPISLEAGAWLKVTASSVTGIYAVALKRTA